MAYGTILVLYPNVSRLADKVKKLFLKPPAMIELFKINAPDTPSQRLGTWLDSSVCYAENFQIVCSAVSDLDRGDASSIAILQEIFSDKLTEGTINKTWAIFMRI
jgi:hypothetical protein